MKGTTKEDLNDFKIALVWKDQKTLQAERSRVWLRKEYAVFLTAEPLPAEKEAVFLDAKLRERKILSHWQQGPKPGWQATRQTAALALENELKAALGEDFFRKYKGFEDLHGGRH